MRIFAQKQWLLCLCAACVAACSMESAPTGACGDLALGYGECQCTAPADAYSRDSMNSSSPSRRELADCKAGSSMSYALKNLKDNEIYACVAYRCIKAECPEGMISSEDQESCVEPPTCGKGEVQQKNICACDAENHWTGKAGSCACDSTKGFVESEGVCKCEKIGLDDYVEQNGTCVKKKGCDYSKEMYVERINDCACDPEKAYVDSNECVKRPDPTHAEAQIWDSSVNKWVCNADAFWKVDPQNYDRCLCIDGYVNMKDGQVDASLTGSCEKIPTCGTKEKIQNTTNTCICDNERHWQGNAPNCTCDTASGKYMLVNENQCEPTTKCDPVTQIYQEGTNSCACNTAENWLGTVPNCTCGGGNKSYVVFTRDGKTMCGLQAKCTQAGQKYVAESNTCACDTDSHWADDGNGACKCDGAHRVNVDGECVCDAQNHWYDVGGTCVEKSCDGYLFNEQCVHIKDTVTFGHYKQASENADPISWLVLDAKPDTDGKGGKLLLLSQYVLDAKPWNDRYDNVWSTSSIRAWLNGDFKNDAFNRTDQGLIVTMPILTEGKSTNDAVFLLSTEEVRTAAYFSSDAERIAKATTYAIKQGVLVKGEEGSTDPSGETTCSNVQCSALWWLRSPGVDTQYAASVYCGGSVYFGGNFVNEVALGVRPALWVHY